MVSWMNIHDKPTTQKNTFDCTGDFLSTMKIRDTFFQRWVSLPKISDLFGTIVSWVGISNQPLLPTVLVVAGGYV